MNNDPEQAGSEKPMKQQEGEAGGGGILNKKIRSLKKLMMMLKNKKKMDRHHHPWKSIILSTSSSFRLKQRVKTIHHSFFDNVVFKIVSVCEGVVLVSTVCFFFLCCGCHF